MMDVMDAMVGTSYGTPYSATSGSGYAAPAATYGAPSTGYDAHQSYSARTSFYDDGDVS